MVLTGIKQSVLAIKDALAVYCEVYFTGAGGKAFLPTPIDPLLLADQGKEGRGKNGVRLAWNGKRNGTGRWDRLQEGRIQW